MSVCGSRTLGIHKKIDGNHGMDGGTGDECFANTGGGVGKIQDMINGK